MSVLAYFTVVNYVSLIRTCSLMMILLQADIRNWFISIIYCCVGRLYIGILLKMQY